MDNWIILGVGNPGDKYANTKHNVPWWILDSLQKKLSVYKKYQKKEKNYLEVRYDLDEYSIYTIYTTTFFNNSGLAIKLEEGRIRIRRKGSSGGHNGLKSIINHLGTDKFIRLRVGIGKPHQNEDQIKYVLSKVKNEKLVNKSCEDATDACINIIENGITKSMEKFNGEIDV